MTTPERDGVAGADGPRGGLHADADRSWRNLNTGRLLYGSFQLHEEFVLAALHAANYGHIRRAHFHVLRHLDIDGTRMTELAARANLTKAAITALVRACETMGLVTVGPEVADGRVRLVRFTAEGNKLMRVFQDTMITMEQRLRHRLGEQAYEALRAALLDLCGLTGVVAFSLARTTRRRRTG